MRVRCHSTGLDLRPGAPTAYLLREEDSEGNEDEESQSRKRGKAVATSRGKERG